MGPGRAGMIEVMLIIGNWKSYVEKKEDAKKLLANAKRIAGKTRHKIVIAPPAPFLALLSGDKRALVKTSAQDISETTVGASTGEVSASVIKDAGATYVIIGHSERRARGETDALISQKVIRALSVGLIPVVCVGEKERDVNAGYLQVLRAQLDAVFSKLTPKDRAKVVVAYEPVWAIGKTAKDAAAPRDVAEMMLYIKKVLAPYGAEKAVVIYGGSVESANAKALMKEGGVGGFLIGHASADAKMFSALVSEVS